MPIAEYFSERRMATCIKTFQQMYDAGPKQIQIYTDESIEDKVLDDVSKMYFDIVTPSGEASLPFLDMLVAFKMILKYNKKQKKNQQEMGFTIKTIFNEEEAASLLSAIKRRIGITVKSETV